MTGAVVAAIGIAILGGISNKWVTVVVLIAASVGVYMGVKEAVGKRVKLWQIDIETPQRWMFLGPALWPIANGAALGISLTSRLGFPIFYAVPAFVVATQSLAAGAVVWGTYSLLRALFALPLGAMILRSRDSDAFSIGVVHAIPQVRRWTGLLLVCLSVLAALAIL